MSMQYVWIGTYTEPIRFGTGQLFQGKGEGIYLCAFEHGTLRRLSCVQTRNPSFLCLDQQRRRIYAVNELKRYLGQEGGGCSQFSYDLSGSMRPLHTAAVGGADPCHIAIAPGGGFLAAANFSGGSLSIIPLDEAGDLLDQRIRVFQHHGKSIHPQRQCAPHAHSVIFHPREHWMVVPDLGADMLAVYRYEENPLEVRLEQTLPVRAGSGPRSGEFSQDGRHFYLLNELSCDVVHYTVQRGGMEEHERLSTLPPDFQGDNICSDLHMVPDGKHLYASNRGHDSICCFSVNERGGLELVERVPCGGRTPRNFAIDPRGEYLLAGNQDSDSISVFRIGHGGNLRLVDRIGFPTPVCIRFSDGA